MVCTFVWAQGGVAVGGVRVWPLPAVAAPVRVHPPRRRRQRLRFGAVRLPAGGAPRLAVQRLYNDISVRALADPPTIVSSYDKIFWHFFTSFWISK